MFSRTTIVLALFVALAPASAGAASDTELQELRKELDAMRANYEARLQQLEARLKKAEADAARALRRLPRCPPRRLRDRSGSRGERHHRTPVRSIQRSP